ncbi:MAG: hypothetical protein AB1611_18705 [bacterium]
MKKAFRSLIIVTLFVLSLCHVCGAEYWEKVVSKGFGDPANDYAWSMTTFQGKLYVGTLNLLKGAEIWRSGSGEPGTWERVYNSKPGPVRSNSGIRYLYADSNQYLYACASNLSGAEILRTSDGKEWIIVGKRGIGNVKNTSIRCMVRFGKYLYGGAGNNGAKLLRSKSGLNWEVAKTNPDFESTKVFDPNTNAWVVNNILVGEMTVFKDKLYAITWTKDLKPTVVSGALKSEPTKDLKLPQAPGAFEIWRSGDGVSWEKVVGKEDRYGNGMGFCLRDSGGLNNDIVTASAVYKDQLYLGTQNSDGNTSIWRTHNGTQWTKVLAFQDLGEKYNYYIWRLISFRDKLYVGTLNEGSVEDPGVTGAQIWVSDSGDPGSFYNLVHNGFDGETLTLADIEMPKNYGIRCFGILNDTLFAGTATVISVPVPKYDRDDKATIAGKDVGCEIWKMVP